ncbi:c-type cytochrome [Paenibacillus sp. HJGM_3]|uniref:c-type cytochrome n=1 Tax=Paenibacillus sp. HJGM_3 TaxID=3379816 RepID=UPI00386E0373
MMKTFCLMLLSMATFVLAAGCQGNRQGAEEHEALADPNNKAAVAIYKRQCISCHAADLGGRVGPSLKELGAIMSTEQIAGKIAEGGSGMPAFSNKLTKEEINLLAVWLDQLETR